MQQPVFQLGDFPVFFRVDVLDFQFRQNEGQGALHHQRLLAQEAFGVQAVELAYVMIVGLQILRRYSGHRNRTSPSRMHTPLWGGKLNLTTGCTASAWDSANRAMAFFKVSGFRKGAVG